MHLLLRVLPYVYSIMFGDPAQIVEKQLKSAKIGHDAALVDKQKAYTKAARLKEVARKLTTTRGVRLSGVRAQDYDSLKRRYDRIRSAHTSNGNDEFLEEELRVTKMRLKCSVENGAWKEVRHRGASLSSVSDLFSISCTRARSSSHETGATICLVENAPTHSSKIEIGSVLFAISDST